MPGAAGRSRARGSPFTSPEPRRPGRFLEHDGHAVVQPGKLRVGLRRHDREGAQDLAIRPAPAHPRSGVSFFLRHIRGSHHYLRHPDKPGVPVTVPVHNRDLKRGTLRAILRDAGITPDELRDLL